MKPRLLLLLCTLLFTASQAQRLTKESTYEISGKANRGYMYEPVIDEANNKLSLTFVTKATNKKAKFETYNFDLDFNFKGKEDSEMPLEKVKFQSSTWLPTMMSFQNSLPVKLVRSLVSMV